jgi:hypothetical protein
MAKPRHDLFTIQTGGPKHVFYAAFVDAGIVERFNTIQKA